MITVFIEYKLISEKREEALALLAERESVSCRLGARQYRCLEGCDQPGLFVETFEVDSMEQYEQIKQTRLEDEAFCACIAGGANKLNIWAFAPVRS
ncbi:MAG TPA: MFS transporter [Brevibacillus sp.]|nr:MFS transporter [Brevibacillus sp.]